MLSIKKKKEITSEALKATYEYADTNSIKDVVFSSEFLVIENRKPFSEENTDVRKYKVYVQGISLFLNSISKVQDLIRILQRALEV